MKWNSNWLQWMIFISARLLSFLNIYSLPVNSSIYKTRSFSQLMKRWKEFRHKNNIFDDMNIVETVIHSTSYKKTRLDEWITQKKRQYSTQLLAVAPLWTKTTHSTCRRVRTRRSRTGGRFWHGGKAAQSPHGKGVDAESFLFNTELAPHFRAC